MLPEENKKRQEMESEGNLSEIINNYKKLIKNTQDELNTLKDVQASAIETQLKSPRVQEKTKQVRFDDESVEKLKLQILQLCEERDTLYTLWKASQLTISDLQSEINNYRNQCLQQSIPIKEVENKYGDTIQLLENTIKTLRHELVRQDTINKELLTKKQQIEENFEEFKVQNELITTEKTNLYENCLKLEELNTHLQMQLSTSKETNKVLENSLQVARNLINESIQREKYALEKVQEAVLVAEIAIDEKEKALCREKIIRDEHNELVEIIGQVMEEAAKQADKNYEELRKQYEEQIKNLENSNKETKDSLEKQIKLNELTEERSKKLEKKLKEVLQENVVLDADLQVASQAIIEMELKLGAVELLLDHDKKSQSVGTEKETELQEILDNCKCFKKRWKNTIEEITKKFQKEIQNLQNENTSLKLENQELNLKLLNR